MFIIVNNKFIIRLNYYHAFNKSINMFFQKDKILVLQCYTIKHMTLFYIILGFPYMLLSKCLNYY